MVSKSQARKGLGIFCLDYLWRYFIAVTLFENTQANRKYRLFVSSLFLFINNMLAILCLERDN